MSAPTNKKAKVTQTILSRAANEAARAVVRLIEQQTGKDVPFDDCMLLVRMLGAALEMKTGGELRQSLARPYNPPTRSTRPEVNE